MNNLLSRIKWCRNLVLPILSIIFALTLSVTRVIANFTEKGEDPTNESSQKYYYEMDKKAQKEFFKRLKLIKIGDSVRKVKNILGEPTYDQTGVSKEKGEFRARIFEYYVKIWEKDLVNEKHDRSVRLTFNAQNVLIEIKSNVEGHQM